MRSSLKDRYLVLGTSLVRGGHRPRALGQETQEVMVPPRAHFTESDLRGRNFMSKGDDRELDLSVAWTPN